MKYMLISLAAMAVCFAAAYLAARLARKAKPSRIGRGSTVLITLGGGTVLLLLAALLYLGAYSRADETAQAALNGSDTVTVEKIDGGYLFDGPSDDRAIVFYPGAKVQTEAYAPLMCRLADAGFDCFLADMPLRCAFLNMNAADKFIAAYDYDEWILAGHSLGGICASGYAAKHAYEVSGLVLLASYSTVKIPDDIKVVSIYGSEDGCLEPDQYKQNRGNLSAKTTEILLMDGNHAQFGNYGAQSGDGTAEISADEQQELTVQAVTERFE